MATKKVSNCVAINIPEPTMKQGGIQTHLVESERIIREDILPRLQNIYCLLCNESLALDEVDVREPECILDSSTNIRHFMNVIVDILNRYSEKI